VSRLRRIVRDPLVHFLVIGLGIFGGYGLLRDGPGDATDTRTVVVDRDALLTFIQYRSKAFEPELAEQRLESLSPAELERLIDDYVREEVLYREAIALGLDRGDYVLRRRVVQKLEFVTRGFAEADSSLDEAALREFFDENRADYFVEPHVTFTHVFFDAERRGWPEARRLARAKRAELDRTRVPFEDALRHGDRFPYHVNYVERTPAYVASHFGPGMARAVSELEPSGGAWHGPFESPYGAHLVMLTRREAGRQPTLEEIRGRVVEDARRAAIRRRVEATVRELVDAYEVRLVYERDGRGADGAAPAR
jgi:ADP-ribose pyrophosphatase YjhB (NUDIX family)